jgi:hypothetical protein
MHESRDRDDSQDKELDRRHHDLTLAGQADACD